MQTHLFPACRLKTLVKVAINKQKWQSFRWLIEQTSSPAGSLLSYIAVRFGVCDIDSAGLSQPAGPQRAEPLSAAPGPAALWSAPATLSGGLQSIRRNGWNHKKPKTHDKQLFILTDIVNEWICVTIFLICVIKFSWWKHICAMQVAYSFEMSKGLRAEVRWVKCWCQHTNTLTMIILACWCITS